MLKWWLELDTQMYLFINNLEVPKGFETFFVTITMLNQNTEFLIYGAPILIAIWFYYGGVKARRALVALAIVVGTTDFTANEGLKKTFKRRRPHRVKTLDAQLRLPYSPKGYSFVSNHSANMFSAATVLSAYYPPFRYVFFIYAALVAFSRTFVGVHYPSDILFGGLYGFLIGLLFLKFFLRRLQWFWLGGPGGGSEG